MGIPMTIGTGLFKLLSKYPFCVSCGDRSFLRSSGGQGQPSGAVLKRTLTYTPNSRPLIIRHIGNL